METASFTGILRTIAIFVLIYFAIRFLMRIFAPMILQQVVKKAERTFHEQQQSYRENPQQQAYNNTPPRPKERKKVGEYIDYEEIE